MPGWIPDVQGYREILDAGGNPVARRKMLQVTGATVTDDGSKTVIAVPAGAAGATGPTGATGATGAGFDDQNTCILKEDFCAVTPGLTADGVFWGDRSPWTFDLIAGTANIEQRSTIDTNHPGQLSVPTGPTTGEWSLALGDSSLFTNFASFKRIRVVVRMSGNVANTITSIGVASVAGNPNTSAAHGAFFHADPATNANWRARTRDGSTQTANVDTGIAITAATWYVLDIEKDVSTQDLTFRINGSTVATAVAATHSIDAADTIKIVSYYDNNGSVVSTPVFDLIIYESVTLNRTT
jgi:hypothetical protein